MEHGAIDFGTAHAMIAATAGTDCAAIVRVPENEPALVKHALDLRAEDIFLPLIRTVEDAERAVASMRYPPQGTRGFGPFIAQSRWQSSLPTFRADTEAHLITVLLIETRDAVENIEAICAVVGIDLLVTAMFDLATHMGNVREFDHPEVKDALRQMEAAAFAAGIPLASNALTEEMAHGLFSRGYRGVAGFDLLWLREKTAAFKSWTVT